jgi:hypothetical protein
LSIITLLNVSTRLGHYRGDSPILCYHSVMSSRSPLPRCLRRESAVARLLGLRVRTDLECCGWSGRGLCIARITRPNKCSSVIVKSR